jgi:hypothetical protein
MEAPLLDLLLKEASTGNQGFPGDLLFGMALSKAISGGKDFHKEVKDLVRKATLASPVSVRAMGIWKSIDAAITSEHPEADEKISQN